MRQPFDSGVSKNNVEKKRVVFYSKYVPTSGFYHVERALLTADMLEDMDIFFFLDAADYESRKLIEGKGYSIVGIKSSTGFINALKEVKPHLLVRDGEQTDADEMKLVKKIVPAIIHFDDFGAGGKDADLVFHTLYQENREPFPSHYVSGLQSFVLRKEFLPFKHRGLEKTPPGPLPHLVIYHGHEDPENLTYRTLRHILQLQIPLFVTILLGEGYKHSIDDLKMMALGRRNTTIITTPYSLPEELAKADIVICSAGYTPFEIAVMGLPCIVIAQNELELQNAFPKEEHGFIHVGLGRKVKQSILLNAVMEMLLHDSRRKRAISRQVSLDLFSGQEKVVETILYYLEYPPRISFTLSKEVAHKNTPNMLQ